MKLAPWIEAMRLRTLPVSVSGVICASALAVADGAFECLPASLCLIFAVLAQIASNFANEYYDFKSGLDKSGREGPRRGVTEGDITPRAMRVATFLTLSLACVTGCSLIYWGGWWLIVAGIMIAFGVLAYSTGPYPLSHHGMGEIAVIFFFGLIPVNLTYYIMAGGFTTTVAMASAAIGLMGANVLIVNNYRDRDDDLAVGKQTLAVKFGRKAMIGLYFANGLIAAALAAPFLCQFGLSALIIVTVAYIALHTLLTRALASRTGRQLNPLLGMTSMLMLAYSIALLVMAIINA